MKKIKLFCIFVFIISVLSCGDAGMHTFFVKNETSQSVNVVKFTGHGEVFSIAAGETKSIDMTYYQAINTFTFATPQPRLTISRESNNITINNATPTTYTILNNLNQNITLIDTYHSDVTSTIQAHGTATVELYEETHNWTLSGATLENGFYFIGSGSDKVAFSITMTNNQIIISAL